MENVLYWVSMIIQDEETSRPWLCSITDGCASKEEAKATIKKGRNSYRVLSAWIDTYDENAVKTTVFHECYVEQH